MNPLIPDEDRDIIVHQFTAVDALTGAPLGERWTVWCGRDSEGAFDSEADALAAAYAAAHERNCPVWLVQHGRPPRLADGPSQNARG
jgi:hypothetical protein